MRASTAIALLGALATLAAVSGRVPAETLQTNQLSDSSPGF